MDPICALDSIFLTQRGVTCERDGDDDGDRDDDRDDDDNSDSDFDLDLDLSALVVEKKPSANAADHVDSNLFLGLLKILVDDTTSEDEFKRRNTRTDYEELMGLTADNDGQMPEVAWYYRNLHLVQKSEIESEDGDVLSCIRNNLGHCKLLNFMLRECLLQRHYRQASFVVWALASLTRAPLVNRDIFTTLLKTSFEIFLAKTSDESLTTTERSRYQISSLEKFIRNLIECRNVDPREVGVDWLVLLLRHGRYADATQLQQRIEAERRKQYHSRSSDPRMEETRRVFTAFTGLACYVYAKMLREGIDDEDTRKDGEESGLNKTVKFRYPEIANDGDHDDCEGKFKDETRLIDELERERAKRELKAEQLDEFAAKSFEEAIFRDADAVWDAFVPPFLVVLSRRGGVDGEKSVLEALEKYREAHPNNPNAHRFLFEHLSKDLWDDENGRSQRRFVRMDDRKRGLLKDSLTSYNKAAPSDKTVVFKLLHYLRLESKGVVTAAAEEEESRRFSAVILFNLLDFPDWRTDFDCWRRLVDILTHDDDDGYGGEESGSVSSLGRSGSNAGKRRVRPEILLRARQLMKRDWFESRADWWPKMHFGTRSADRDFDCSDFKRLVKVKNTFAKFIKRLSRDSFFAGNFDSGVAEKCFKSYGERIEALMSVHGV